MKTDNYNILSDTLLWVHDHYSAYRLVHIHWMVFELPNYCQ